MAVNSEKAGGAVEMSIVGFSLSPVVQHIGGKWLAGRFALKAGLLSGISGDDG
jgi:hypothetical protein